MCFGGGGGGGDGEARQDARDAERRKSIAEGEQAIDAQFAPFNEDFYARTRDAYTRFATPQLTRQEQEARQQLEFALARSGQTNSTVAAKQRGNLDFDVGTQRQLVADRAEQAVGEQRNNVLSARGNITSQLNADANAGAAANAATARAGALAASQPALSPLGELFGNVAKNLSLAAQGEGIVPAGGSAYAGGGSASPRLFQRVR
jgi:hypothetical protein